MIYYIWIVEFLYDILVNISSDAITFIAGALFAGLADFLKKPVFRGIEQVRLLLSPFFKKSNWLQSYTFVKHLYFKAIEYFNYLGYTFLGGYKKNLIYNHLI